MQRVLLLSAAAAAALSLAACQRQATTADAGNTSPGQTEPVNAAQDAMGAAVGSTSAAVLGARDTGAFAENAAQGDMYEIQAAQIAQEKARSPEVKAFAKTMATEHAALQKEMTPLIKAAGKTPPTELDQRRKGLLDNLRAASAEDFDKTYIDQQVAAHDETVTMMKGYADNGDNADLKAAAAKTAPKVQAHLDRAKALLDKLEGKDRTAAAR